MEMGIDNTFGDNSKLHPTQAYALEQAIIMLIRNNLSSSFLLLNDEIFSVVLFYR